MIRSMTRSSALSLALAACSAPSQGEASVVWLDRATFAAKVQPVLAARCGSPECHGRPERALSIYSPLRWRADPARLELDEPLSTAELDHDYVASCISASAGDPWDAPALTRKALGDKAGVYHGGGAIFDGTADPDYQALAAWIAAGPRAGAP